MIDNGVKHSNILLFKGDQNYFSLRTCLMCQSTLVHGKIVTMCFRAGWFWYECRHYEFQLGARAGDDVP